MERSSAPYYSPFCLAWSPCSHFLFLGLQACHTSITSTSQEPETTATNPASVHSSMTPHSEQDTEKLCLGNTHWWAPVHSRRCHSILHSRTPRGKRFTEPASSCTERVRLASEHAVITISVSSVCQSNPAEQMSIEGVRCQASGKNFQIFQEIFLTLSTLDMRMSMAATLLSSKRSKISPYSL